MNQWKGETKLLINGNYMPITMAGAAYQKGGEGD